jgi:flagellar protein FliS
MQSRVSLYLEQEILSASPVQLVHLLYQTAMTELRDARRNLAGKQIPAKCANITKACNIILELQTSLDLEAGGELSTRLQALYGYMLCKLLDANLKNADGPMAEVLGLLSTLDEAWEQLANQRQEQGPSQHSAAIPAAMFSSPDALDSSARSWSL